MKPAKGLALQYELKLSEGLSCGGAYLKFVSDSKDYEPSSLKEATPYTIMFGADKCGSTNKVSERCSGNCCNALLLPLLAEHLVSFIGPLDSPASEAKW